ncbi:MAG: DUF1836 domain-containing protein [Oscillibacter sp.]|jgi:hypothetical protein|nr:DUF1836 domain-containing protein [Oscillibacter sp.]
MDELSELRERLRTQRPVEWDQLPDFPLYMDQVLSYMDRQILHFEENDALTAAMVNNYTKSGLVPRAEGKKYNREHLAYLTAICVLKRVLSAKDMSLVLEEELHSRQDIGASYEVFRDSLGKALNLTTDIMEAYTSESDAADGAVHFALLSYAAGLASSRYVKILEEKRKAEEPVKHVKEKHTRLKKETE